MRPCRAALAKFFDAIKVADNGCWEWQRTLSRGYGQFCFNGFATHAHRVAHLWFIGPIPPRYHVDHLCCNKRCVNPAHLEAVTGQENIERAVQRRCRTVLLRHEVRNLLERRRGEFVRYWLPRLRAEGVLVPASAKHPNTRFLAAPIREFIAKEGL